jgi:hypothetical protein
LLTTAAQFAALTSFEAYLIQLWVLRRAKGLPDLDPPFRPADHVFASFEYRIPLSLGPQASPLVIAHLVDNGHASSDVDVTSPSFRCCFCRKIKSFITVRGYWAHIRDQHGLVNTTRRLEEIKRSATAWQEHLADRRRRLGSGTRSDDSTCAKLKQIQEEDFDWEVVKSWKLRYNWER